MHIPLYLSIYCAVAFLKLVVFLVVYLLLFHIIMGPCYTGNFGWLKSSMACSNGSLIGGSISSRCEESFSALVVEV